MEVTTAHYTTLQDRLTKLRADCASPGYNGSPHDIQNIKLSILRPDIASASSQPQHPDNNPDNNYDDMELSFEDIDSLFPSTLRFLDLSSLKLSATPFTSTSFPSY